MTSKETNQNNLSEFFRDEYHQLKGYVRSKLEDTADGDAEDIIQDVALRLFSRPEEALPITNIGGFVYHSLKNKIIDVMRTKKRIDRDEDLAEKEDSSFSDHYQETMNEGFPEELIRKLRPIILSLKPPYRDIIIAIDYEGYSYREISEQTGISIGTLMSRRHRALAQLHKKLNRIKN
ncbi:RNA polymerase sigma factor [Croceivirga thetidis]|uniref:RNA polymerase sigma factor n=1 Tax=Croceivirga thetidis TaxID=2721623 RepID=A0ABX1GPF8_9FLAO|nr:RNA polymerase sigma factor [Croceivirga thetidis]NKI30971.1 RNA polymerase sigma factor [Croceivirga thetidis]